MAKKAVVKFNIEDLWPPKWFFSYTDLATLLMTFFVVLATMITLNIKFDVVEGDAALPLTQEEIKKLTELQKSIEELTPEEKEIITKVGEDMNKKQMEFIKESLQAKRNMESVVKKIKDFVKSKNLEDVVDVKSDLLHTSIIPKEPLFFSKGRARLKPQAAELLGSLAEIIKDMPSDITIEGHTDNTPVIHKRYFKSNWELSIARANSVMRYFTEKHGMPAEKIKAIGFGEHKPIAPNDTPENKAKNRRVVIRITPSGT